MSSSDGELEKSEKEILKLLTAWKELQDDLIELRQEAIKTKPKIWSLRKSRKQLNRLQNKHSKLSKDIELVLKSGHTISEFEKSNRFNGNLSTKEVIGKSVGKFRPVLEKNRNQISERDVTVERIISNRRRDIINQTALVISLIAIILSTTAIII
ncbi:hypothetical protein AMET1_0004 [Methanonatronarchaeum thermophilum]|uniref:Uncharacterized protein n=1 Tax=Methanonatronarchaeum thermophilum TaxID=1927129 RepID=A0A1Y3GIS5_9EURY|nr:hypothetical protein [Methanonatronarchaeum thermophilum]OUJ19335.1 hypothetical protein AMET1_0004 [Methanonatronarchaeum thermophilum]